MPGEKEIRQFEQTFNELAGEKEILEERGEAIEELPFSAAGAGHDLSDLFAETEAGSAASGGEEAGAPVDMLWPDAMEDEGPSAETGSLIGDFSLDEGAEASEPTGDANGDNVPSEDFFKTFLGPGPENGTPVATGPDDEFAFPPESADSGTPSSDIPSADELFGSPTGEAGLGTQADDFGLPGFEDFEKEIGGTQPSEAGSAPAESGVSSDLLGAPSDIDFSDASDDSGFGTAPEEDAVFPAPADEELLSDTGSIFGFPETDAGSPPEAGTGEASGAFGVDDGSLGADFGAFGEESAEAGLPPSSDLDIEGGGADLGAGSRAAGTAETGDDFVMPDFDTGTAESAEGAPVTDDFAFPAMPGSNEASTGSDLAPSSFEETTEFMEETPSSDAGFGFDLGAESGAGVTPQEDLWPADAGRKKPAAAGKSQGAGDQGLGGQAEDSFVIDEFDLGDFGQKFGLDSASTAASYVPPADQEEAEEGAPRRPTGRDEAAFPEEDLKLSDEDFGRLKITMENLPRNLRLIIEDLIGIQELHGEHLRELVKRLVQGQAPKLLALYAETLVGKPIPIPKAYEKKSGLAFEEERQSLSYVLRHYFLPLFAKFVGAAAAVVLFVYLAGRFAYRPLVAISYYRQGIERIQTEEYEDADSLFNRALELWSHRSWFRRYAEAYRSQGEFERAGRMYDGLLERYGYDRRGLLDYSYMETFDLEDYPSAENHISAVLRVEPENHEAGLALGENYLEWGWIDASRYESARVAFAHMLQRFGEEPETLFDLLRTFIRMDNIAAVVELKEHLKTYENLEPDAPAYAELGGYLITRQTYDDAREFLVLAIQADPNLPEAYYHLSRYYRIFADTSQLYATLANALMRFDELPLLDPRQYGMRTEVLNWIGDWYTDSGEYLNAQENYRQAIEAYENGLGRTILDVEPRFGEIYANYGDLFYYHFGDPDRALGLYETAVDNLYDTPELRYRMGFVHYLDGDFEGALEQFALVAETYPEHTALVYAQANALFQRGAYFAAEGLYRELLEDLRLRREELGLFDVADNSSHDLLIRNTIKVTNNLGVALERIADRSPNTRHGDEAVAQYAEAIEMANLVSRDQATWDPVDVEPLARLNLRSVLYPDSGYRSQISTEIPLDLNDDSY